MNMINIQIKKKTWDSERQLTINVPQNTPHSSNTLITLFFQFSEAVLESISNDFRSSKKKKKL